ncbi:hypothetical protein LPU83_pLPU83b_0563 (plasmid) [Rhizobium favelukesii]|uniref:Uncharacterized protein n=1 Tax=Rhizobium favelukesii TaxID=348824 RepID=W6RNW1_9HYPH|nr:hypothetical protein LPU83_pLPU83b_0563 [Rhizobium favelukesii]
MTDLRHPSFPPAELCAVKMRVNGCLLIVMTQPATYSPPESPVLAQQPRDPTTSRLKSSNTFAFNFLPRGRHELCPRHADLFERVGSESRTRRCLPRLVHRDWLLRVKRKWHERSRAR